MVSFSQATKYNSSFTECVVKDALSIHSQRFSFIFNFLLINFIIVNSDLIGLESHVRNVCIICLRCHN